ncbi:MAG: transketolase C-terminal domain-containing protein [Thermoplasmata archaeon]
MTDARRSESLWEAYGKTLVELGEIDPNVVALAFEPPGTNAADPFRERFPARYFKLEAATPAAILTAAGHAREGHSVYASTTAAFAAGTAYHSVRESLCAHRVNVKIVADEGGSTAGGQPETHPFLEDVGIMRGLPGMTVIVPADAPSTRGAILALHVHPGPAYVRLTRGVLPTVTDGSFEVGRASELRAGKDLTIVAVGALVARALEVARTLAEVGISTRVLDFASVKPFDEPALLRAARDTGAILVLEEHTVLTGVGALVASTTSENYPVPVRRVGVPDLFVESVDPQERLDRYGLGPERIRDEAWELLRLRGRVS